METNCNTGTIRNLGTGLNIVEAVPQFDWFENTLKLAGTGVRLL